MSKEKNLQRVLDGVIVAVLRASSSNQLVQVAETLADVGISSVEVTLTVPGAIEVIRETQQQLGDRLFLGAGTVLDPESARSAILAGADYIVTPTVNVDVIRMCQRYGKLVMPGAFTPTEILTAWEAGADIVKVFPADVGGPSYLKAIHGPLPQIRLMPTGGVDLKPAERLMKQGACALGVGGALVEKDAVARGDMDRIRTLGKQYVEIIEQYRKSTL